MLAQPPTQNKPLILIPAKDFEEGRWVQVSLPTDYHIAKRTALAWKDTGRQVMLEESPDGWRAFVLAVKQ